MATIVLIEHALQRQTGTDYMAHLLARFWREQGHKVYLQCGTDNPPPADLAVLHVDLTTVPQAYVEMASRYPRTINLGVTDISKRGFRGDDVLTRDSSWPGRVIVKTNANFGGRIDQYLRDCQLKLGLAADIADAPVLDEYPVYPTLQAVPSQYWMSPHYVVEKFTPEQDARGNYMRVWVFLGDRERSMRYRSAADVIKSANFIDGEPVAVPDELRAWRERLKFDFGKFDYVMHEGRCVLLDVNRTPGAPPVRMPGVVEAYRAVAAGVEGFL
ncbi:MAG: hypothetical protein SF172_18830 [Burkholderiales bacterium]|nr:hypothetical protein [Burkholderiales bacterium]